MSEVRTIDVVMKVPKESKEIVDYIVAILRCVKEKKGIGSIISEAVTGLSTAIDGWDQVDDEAKSQYRDELAGYVVQQVLDVIMPIKKNTAPSKT